ncbi:ketoisovalerate oxidoreductase [Candidatus Shapirobacteria bacterium CG10_big_fil_rev_8_21_14_0_10_40_9]|uniref:Ketoisovalerate oxidoreductase n=1 Tax=Candidatus Shapirobacteria bacterium CG10_big_fil_rev_8_21_14_0_10_40_9 TaxID=1974888 RepID=A0A2M8L3X8_9BACT|nr:MAG: ketoisovalerate oxidoreductase [Candidatus Shapirobacteria bacterium CG10_big_fil_rev_8_21_14_0_10_40_9]
MKVLLAGEGGQGVQLAGEILALAAFNEGKQACLIPNFGVEQRGGVSLAFVKIEEGSYPKFEKADVLGVFCDRAIERVKNYIAPGTKIIAGPAVTGEMVNDRNLPAKVWNILILGEIVKETGIVKKESLKKALEERLGEKFKKNPELREINFKALE